MVTNVLLIFKLTVCLVWNRRAVIIIIMIFIIIRQSLSTCRINIDNV